MKIDLPCTASPAMVAAPLIAVAPVGAVPDEPAFVVPFDLFPEQPLKTSAMISAQMKRLKARIVD